MASCQSWVLVAAAARSRLISFASQIILIFSTKDESFIFLSKVLLHLGGTWMSLGLCPEIRMHWKCGWIPPHPQQGFFVFFWPHFVPSFQVVSVPERFRDVDQAQDDSTIIVGLWVCSFRVDPSGPILSKQGSAAKAARVTLPLPATFMPLLMDFWSQACLSSLDTQ